jgi:hypothetical protein
MRGGLRHPFPTIIHGEEAELDCHQHEKRLEANFFLKGNDSFALVIRCKAREPLV